MQFDEFLIEWFFKKYFFYTIVCFLSFIGLFSGIRNHTLFTLLGDSIISFPLDNMAKSPVWLIKVFGLHEFSFWKGQSQEDVQKHEVTQEILKAKVMCKLELYRASDLSQTGSPD